MRTTNPAGPGRLADRGVIERCLRWMTTHLLIAYLAAVTAQRLWAVLNTDVRLLLR